MTDTERVIQQRMRNRLMDYFELAGSFDAQRTCGSRHVVNAAYEVINRMVGARSSGPTSPRGVPHTRQDAQRSRDLMSQKNDYPNATRWYGKELG